jgi:uncharacterized protein (TIGR00730 family)
MNVAVFCSAKDLENKYSKPAKKLAELLAEAGHTLVWGGSDVGLMKLMADGVQQGGGKIIGMSLEYYHHNARKNADEMIVSKTLGERKAALLEHSDIIVTLVGGFGTLDEITEILELKKQQHHDKMSIVLNTDGFYDGLKMQLERISDEGLVTLRERGVHSTRPLSDFVQFVDTPEEVMQLIGEGQTATGTMEVPLKQNPKK